MAQMYDTQHSLHVPLDGRLWLGILWLWAVTLMALDSLDREFGIVGAWGLLLALAGVAWTGVVLHAYSRRALLDVMSYEHRQQTSALTNADRMLTPTP